MINLRSANNEQDADVMQGLYNEAYPGPIPNVQTILTTQDVRIAEADDGCIAGFRALSPGHFVWIAVSADHQRKGIGTLLMNDVLEQVSKSGASELTSRVANSQKAGLAFCQKFGFTPYLHMVNLELDLTTWDDSALIPALRNVADQGIQLKTYADYGDREENRQRLYELNKALSATIPRDEPQPFADFDTYVQRRILPPAYHHNGIFLAVDGDTWIGMSQISLHESHAFQEMTGVLPDYRGHGVAQALKLLALQFARHNNQRIIKTFNDVSNAPMIAVNEKIGYQRGESFYFMRRKPL
jgi:GNAT superfamily N-acetyltransferase